jgi:hypothetical protein
VGWPEWSLYETSASRCLPTLALQLPIGGRGALVPGRREAESAPLLIQERLAQ